MGYDQVVETSALKLMGDIFKKCAAYGLVNSVKQNGFFVTEKIRVVGNAVGNAVDALEAGEAAVICADPDEIGGNIARAVHNKPPDMYHDITIIYYLIFSKKSVAYTTQL